MARLRTIDGYGCDWHDDNEPDGRCTCLFKCDSCGTEYRQGDHPAEKCVVELTRQLAEARKASELQKITPENLPKAGSVIWSAKHGIAILSGYRGLCTPWVATVEELAEDGFSHFLPTINPPALSAEQKERM